MGNTNFKIFNELYLPDTTMSDLEYVDATQRTAGVLPGIAMSRMHNKLYRQATSGVKALADLLVRYNYNCNDGNIEEITDNIENVIKDIARGLINEASFNIRRANTSYSLGDVVTTTNIPSWSELQCIQAGITSSDNLINYALIGVGQQISDGEVIWALRDKQCSHAVGEIFSWSGQMQNNGHPIHPLLNLPILDCRFCDGTNGTPDLRDKFLKCGLSIDNINIPDGSNTILLSLSQIPSHSHIITVYGSGSHTHPTSIIANGKHKHKLQSVKSGYWLNGEFVDYLVKTPANEIDGEESGLHSHGVVSGVGGFHGHTTSCSVVGSNAPITINPAHYKLAFLKKIY